MRTTHKTHDGLVNYYCIKCEVSVGALVGSTSWCQNGHRMSTKKELEVAEQRRLDRESKKDVKNG